MSARVVGDVLGSVFLRVDDFRSGVVVDCFFFQAEDGIRDWSVTGVQTCALPIYLRAALNRGFPNLTREEQIASDRVEQFRAMSVGTGSAGGFAVPYTLDPTVIPTSSRSEERRVGEEGKAAWCAGKQNKKEERGEW